MLLFSPGALSLFLCSPSCWTSRDGSGVRKPRQVAVPPPQALGRHAQQKKGRSEEREAKEEDDIAPQNLDIDMNTAAIIDKGDKIQDVIEDIRDLKDQMNCSRNQVSYLLCHEVDKQRTEAAGTFICKNFWQYMESEGSYELLCEHRENMITWMAKEAGISPKDLNTFHLEHRRGKALSPLTMVNTGNFHKQDGTHEPECKHVRKSNMSK